MKEFHVINVILTALDQSEDPEDGTSVVGFMAIYDIKGMSDTCASCIALFKTIRQRRILRFRHFSVECSIMQVSSFPCDLWYRLF